MPRDIPVGNGTLLVTFDKFYKLRDLYFPHVGQENHTKSSRIGVWVNGAFSWVSDGWTISRNYLEKDSITSLVTDVSLLNESLKLKIAANDVVDFHENIYLKKLTFQNLSDSPQEVRLFITHDFEIYGNDVGDTAAFRPENNSLLHYKKDRYFLINTFAHGKFGIDYFATGNKKKESFEGTWRDAEDGVLSKNPIAQGSVDSVFGIHFRIPPKSFDTCYYWIAAGKNWTEVKELNETVQKRTPELFFKRTFDYWKLWVGKESWIKNLLPDLLYRLYQRSLLVARTQMNTCGSIIAANDSDVIQFNRDTYCYMWPRDGALVAYALDLAGYPITSHFYDFCGKIIEKDGYFLHKYTPSGSLASSWHPWVLEGKEQLPIQEDETALVIWGLWHHYQKYKDVEYLLNPFIDRLSSVQRTS